MRVLLLVALQVSAGSVPPGAQECYRADWDAPAAVHLSEQTVLQTHTYCQCAPHKYIIRASISRH